jgi:RimJ/RimL family protein N-acetyltransferase
MKPIQTVRLSLRLMELRDADFIVDLLNQDSFIRQIGDKGVRNLADAGDYILKGPMLSYQRHGYGLFLTTLRMPLYKSEIPIGICGLLQREWLDHPDIGFAFLPQYAGQGYATESARAVMDYGRRTHGLKRIVGITAVDNHASIAVLQKIGLRYEGTTTSPDSGKAMQLFGTSHDGTLGA